MVGIHLTMLYRHHLPLTTPTPGADPNLLNTLYGLQPLGNLILMQGMYLGSKAHGPVSKYLLPYLCTVKHLVIVSVRQISPLPWQWGISVHNSQLPTSVHAYIIIWCMWLCMQASFTMPPYTPIQWCNVPVKYSMDQW